tara:strand:- start:420 stop:590 length:171 start_codon:yes stop_codon:yes gene_type:complete
MVVEEPLGATIRTARTEVKVLAMEEEEEGTLVVAATVSCLRYHFDMETRPGMQRAS